MFNRVDAIGEMRMDDKIAGLLGAVAAVAMMGGAHASTGSDPLAAQSYADLLTPIPNATEALVADNARHDANSADGVQLAQYHHHHHHHRYFRYYHHHHHHHHRYYRYHHHHHHGAFFGVPGVGGVIVR
jgi:hypothetical protein